VLWEGYVYDVWLWVDTRVTTLWSVGMMTDISSEGCSVGGIW
jgi:hypothetical protein